MKLRVRHIRNGTELQPILQDNYYDFNYQSPLMRENPIAIIAVSYVSTLKFQSLFLITKYRISPYKNIYIHCHL